MKEILAKIEEIIGNFDDIEKSDIKELMQRFFTKVTNRLENYIGDYPTFIEPVYLGDNVKIGDDVLIGPNVYILSLIHISEPTRLGMISYAVFCLKKKSENN